MITTQLSKHFSLKPGIRQEWSSHGAWIGWNKKIYSKGNYKLGSSWQWVSRVKVCNSREEGTESQSFYSYFLLVLTLAAHFICMSGKSVSILGYEQMKYSYKFAAIHDNGEVQVPHREQNTP